MNELKDDILVNSSVVSNIAEGFLKGRYMSSMNLLKSIAAKHQFSPEEIKVLTKDFLLPNNGSVDVYFENGKMFINTITPDEKADLDKSYKTTEQLIKAGVLRVHVPNSMLDYIARKLAANNYKIKEKEVKKDFAIVTVEKVDESVFLSAKERRDIINNESKQLSSRELIDAFSQGYYSSVIDMIKDYAKKGNYTQQEIQDLERVYRLPNHTAVEIYFEDGKMLFEERGIREQDIYEIQTERIEGLIKGEFDKLDVLNQYVPLTKRYLSKRGAKILSERNNGVFTEFAVAQNYNNNFHIEQDKSEDAEEDIEESLNKLINDALGRTEPAEEKPVEEKKVEEVKSDLDLGYGNQSMYEHNYSEDRFNHKPKLNLMERLQRNVDKLNNESGATNKNKQESVVSESEKQPAVATNEESSILPSGTKPEMDSHVQKGFSFEAFENTGSQKPDQNITEEKNKIQQLVPKPDAMEYDLKPIEASSAAKGKSISGSSDLASRLARELELSKQNQNNKKIIVEEVQFENGIKKYNYNDEKDFLGLKTNMFWILLYLTSKTVILPEKYLETNDIDSYKDVTSMIELLKHASNDYSVRSSVQNKKLGFMTYGQLSRSVLVKLAENKVKSGTLQNVAFRMLNKNISYSKTLEYSSILEMFLKTDDVKKSLQYGDKTIRQLVQSEINKGDSSIIDPIIKMIKSNVTHDLSELVSNAFDNDDNNDNDVIW